MVENNGLEFRNDESELTAAETCCYSLEGGVVVSEYNSCTAFITDSGPYGSGTPQQVSFDLENACFYYSQQLQQAGGSDDDGGGLDPAVAGEWVEVFGDAANSILNLFGLGYQPPPPGRGVEPRRSEKQTDGIDPFGNNRPGSRRFCYLCSYQKKTIT